MNRTPLRYYRTFKPTWPGALIEIADFVNLTRLVSGGQYLRLSLRIHISRSVPPEWLISDVFQEFRDNLQSLPNCTIAFEPSDLPLHRVNIEIER